MWYWLFSIFFRFIFKTFFKLKVEGLENLPEKTNFIMAANHTSFFDPPLIMAAVPRKIYCIAARYLYGIALVSWFLRKIDTFPSGNCSEKAIRLLLKNKNVGIFPEGKLSLDGNLGEFRRGVALLAHKTGRPIVPCAIIGAFEAFPFTARFPKFFIPITVKIGKPIHLSKEFTELIDDIYLQEGVFRLKNAIMEMQNA